MLNYSFRKGYAVIELIIILIVAAALFCFAFRKPATPEVPQVKQQVFEDSSQLKQAYATLEHNHHKTLQELGQLQYSNQLLSNQSLALNNQILVLNERFEKLQHQNKSSQVRTGAIGESLLPLHEDFPCNPKSLRLLGSPIDYISFCYETDTITFIEVKTGESQLNDNQKKVKSMVERGRVQFKVVRLNEKGVKVK